MTIVLTIFINNILPIFLLVGLGYIFGRKLGPDINTLTKLNLYALVPVFTFVYLYTSDIPADMLKVLAFAVIMLAACSALSLAVSRIMGFDKGKKYAFINSVIFYNSGNIGIPLITLVFSSAPFIMDGQTPYLELALTSQIMILVTQNITTNSIGFYNAGRAKMDLRRSLKKILGVPTIYAVPAAFLLKLVPYDLTLLPVWPSLDYMRNALVAVALLTLGVQIYRTKFDKLDKGVILSAFIRLVCGPAIAFVIIRMLSLDGVIAQAVLISSGVPTAVNTALIAVDYDNYPGFASQTVLLSTLLCTLTLPAVIYTARILFPV